MDIKDIEIKLARSPLPVFPNIVAQIMRLSEDPNATSRDYERVITISPDLTAKLLRVANSPYYGYAGQVTTIQSALMRLGNETVRSMCVAVAFQSSVQSKGIPRQMNMDQFWQHSLATACATKILAHIRKSRLKEQAFIAGLLHDIGKLTLYLLMPQEGMSIRKYQSTTPVDDYEAEKKVLGVTHEEVGRLAAQRWGLPEMLCRPISRHHAPLDGEDMDEMTAYVNVGNWLTYEAGLGCSPPGRHNNPDENALAFLNLPMEQYDVIKGAIAKEVLVVGNQFRF